MAGFFIAAVLLLIAIPMLFGVHPPFWPEDFGFVITACLAPVSYTHLDVYKRQGLLDGCEGDANGERERGEAGETRHDGHLAETMFDGSRVRTQAWWAIGHAIM